LLALFGILAVIISQVHSGSGPIPPGPLWTPWSVVNVPRSPGYGKHIYPEPTVSVTIPEGAKMLPDSVQCDAELESTFGRWDGPPLVSDDGRTISRRYDHWWAQLGRRIRIRVQYLPKPQ
jgi:hypothetical protein